MANPVKPLSLLYVLCSFLFIATKVTGNDEECIQWALQRLMGRSNVRIMDEVANVTSSSPPPKSTGVGRPGKRGPGGPPGPIGPIGPPGVCDCIPEEVQTLQRENEDLKEKVKRIRKTAPEVFCLLGMKDDTIPDGSITVSSRPSYARYGRLDRPPNGWHPSPANPTHMGNDWIMADLGKLRVVTGVVTQGRHDSNHWVKSYKIEHSKNGHNFTDVKKDDGSELIFTGNADRSTKVVNRFPQPVFVRFVRIYPMSYNGNIFIRFDIIDC